MINKIITMKKINGRIIKTIMTSEGYICISRPYIRKNRDIFDYLNIKRM